ncbi:MAG TPA: SMP-30/gluconolactonase/LRE family protein [Hanamia sp.]|nr:SMP-30/gluconolactonase/LRE family protein [Hanamia sp.]
MYFAIKNKIPLLVKASLVKGVSFVFVLLLFLKLPVCGQRDSLHDLYNARDFTAPNTFTNGVEGPAADKSGNVYAVNFDHQGTIGKVTLSGEASIFIELPEGSIGNGIRFDSKGNMLIADYKMHNLLKVDMATKNISVYAHEARMTQPNDLAIDSKDRVYASDPNFKENTGRIWRVDKSKTAVLLDSIDGTANGIEVSPDEKILYVGAGRKIFRYSLSKKGQVKNRKLLIEFPDFSTDGMRCDAEGNLYVARIGKGVIAKISPSGKLLREIQLIGKKPTNVAFGGEGGRTVYVTLMDRGNLECFRVESPGREWKAKS